MAAAGQTSLKMPWRSWVEGTWLSKTWPGTTSLRHSSLQKKNVLSLFLLYTFGIYTGPPMVYPKSFFLYSGTFGEKKLRALKSVFRTNSYASPWKSLVPDLVTVSIVPGPLRPYCAPWLEVRTLNSAMASTLG